MVEHLDSTKLVPFRKRGDGYHLPGLAKEHDEQIIDEVDPELRPEEQGYVRHYLAYADIFLKNAESEPAEEEEGFPGSRESSDRSEIHKTRQDGHYRHNGHYRGAA